MSNGSWADSRIAAGPAKRPVRAATKGRGKVLVLGEGTRAPLAVIRSLGEYGLDVHAAWCRPDSPQLRSRYVKRYYDIHSFESNREEWKPDFIRLCQAQEFDLVVPCTDETVIPLQTELDPRAVPGRVYLLSPDAFRATFDKARTLELGAKLGIRQPPFSLVGTVVELLAASRIHGYPLVIRPRSSIDFDKQIHRRGIRVLFSEEELQRFVRDWDARETVIAQEFFTGTGVGVEVLARNGEILVAVQHERLHEQLLGSGSSYRRTVALDEHLRADVAAFVGHVGYTGVLMVEFKQNPRTRETVLIEANGRFWGSLPLAIAAGADFPRFLFQMLVEGRTTFPRNYREQLYARNHILDLMWFRDNWRADRKNPWLITVPPARALWEVRHALLGRETSDSLRLNDPRPAMAELGELLRHWKGKIQVGLVNYLMSAGRWRALAPARLANRIRAGISIVLLCKGNICRSPFAAAYLRQQGIPGLKVESAGYHAKSGRMPPLQALEAARHFGVDLGAHRSRTASAASLKTADLIFIFDAENYLWLRKNAPAVIDRVALLGLARPGAEGAIGDPFGGSVKGYDDCYRAIVQSIDAMLCSLNEAPTAADTSNR